MEASFDEATVGCDQYDHDGNGDDVAVSESVMQSTVTTDDNNDEIKKGFCGCMI